MSKKSRINSRAKGARGEREFCDWLKEHYPERFGDAQRTQQHCGNSGDAADVRSEGFEQLALHPEVKRVERGCLYTWLEQAKNDAGPSGKRPFVAHKRNGREWVVVLRAQDFFDLVS